MNFHRRKTIRIHVDDLSMQPQENKSLLDAHPQSHRNLVELRTLTSLKYL